MACMYCLSEKECCCTHSKRAAKISEYYKTHLAQGHSDFEKLGWESFQAQFCRFEVMLKRVGFNGMSILDVGCGLGNLMDILKTEERSYEYYGVDLLPEMIEQALKKHPEGNWYCCDIFKDCSFADKSFDIVYSSGIFNLDLGNNTKFLQKALRLFSSLAKSYVCFNLLSDKSLQKEKGYYYYSESEIRTLAASHLDIPEESVRIKHSYLPNDMTVFIDLRSPVF